jgi:predicted DNA-binding protein (MmcQ/YjbR family)
MDLEEVKRYCASKKGATWDFPFDAETLVYRVMGKIFALVPSANAPSTPARFNLKCDPVRAELLRQTYSAVIPGYHMNHRHWNSIILDGSIPDDDIMDMVDHSYDMVVKGLSKQEREKLEKG